MGLTVSILKTTGELEQRTLVAITSELAALVGPFEGGPFDPTEERPAIILGVGPTMGPLNIVAYDAVPNGEGWAKQKRPGSGVGPMMNGRWIYTSDSRFPAPGPVRYFDRWESQRDYDANFD